MAGRACTAPHGDSQMHARGRCGPSFTRRVTQRWWPDHLGLCSVWDHTDGNSGSTGFWDSRLCSFMRLARQPFLSERPEVLLGGPERCRSPACAYFAPVTWESQPWAFLSARLRAGSHLTKVAWGLASGSQHQGVGGGFRAPVLSPLHATPSLPGGSWPRDVTA